MPAMSQDITEFQVTSDPRKNQTTEIQKAIDTVSEAGGGTLVFPSGVYCTATVYLKSNVTIHLEAGAVWQGIPDMALYPDIEPAIISRMDTTPWKAFIYAFDQENITLRGEGTIDGRGDHEVWQTGKGNDPNRPYGLHIIGCRNVRVEGLRLRQSAFWMQRYLQCDGVYLSGLKVFNHANHNSDGVDVDSCQNVIVSDCHIDSSDDALCFKSEGAPPCEYVTVTNCVLRSFASAFKLGTGSIGGFRHFSVSNLTIHKPSVQNSTHSLKAEAGLMGIDLGNVDGGVMENINISNVVIEKVETPIFIKLGDRQSRSDRGGPWADAPPARPGCIRNVRITNVTATDVGPIASAIVGFEGNVISGLVLSGITIATARPPKQAHDWDVDLQAKLYPMNRIFNSDLPAYGFYIAYAQGLILSDINLLPGDGDERPAIALQNCEDIRFRAVDAVSRQEHPIQQRDSRAIVLDGQAL